MIGVLQQLSTSVDERENLASAWRAVLKSYLGNEQETQKLSLQEINDKVFGLPGTNAFLANVRLVDITDPSRFPNKELRKYINDISLKCNQLRKIYDMPESDYKYAFRSNEQLYYWIDEDLIP